MSNVLKPTKKIILAATVDAAVSDSFDVLLGRPVTITFGAADGLTTGENAILQVAYDGVNFSDLVTSQDGQVQLNDLNVAITIAGVGTYRVDKDATTNAASLLISY